MSQALLLVSILTLSAVAVGLGLVIAVRSFRTISVPPLLEGRLAAIESAIGRSDTAVREEFTRGREETRESSKSLREEVGSLFANLAESLRSSVTGAATAQKEQLSVVAERLNEARTEGTSNAKDLRGEVQTTLKQLGDAIGERITELTTTQVQKLDAVAAQIGDLTEGNERRQETLRANVEAKLVELKADGTTAAKLLREEVGNNLKTLGEGLIRQIGEISASQKERLDRISVAVTELTQRSGEQQQALRQTVEARLDALRAENAEKLEAMRQTVDEKLQSTLEQRLGASFKMVNDSLEQVYKSVGEMQTLATGVGDLKKVLSNVRARGTWGEVSLGSLLEQFLSPEQYGRNVEIMPGSNQRVEFAVRLPGDDDGQVWLPLDAKYPTEDYERLIAAADKGDIDGIELACKAIEARVRFAAEEIRDKYVHPPHSTDCAVMFLPTEGLFAEVVRRPGLVDAIQRECHVMVAGPTTLASLLTSLRMGFRTLAVQKRSSEVWRVLGAVKTEFGKFERVMDRVQRKLQEAQNVVEEAGVRRRAMGRRLREVEALPEGDAAAMLQLNNGDGSEEDMETEEPGSNAPNDEQEARADKTANVS